MYTKDSFVYSLRITISPGHHVDECLQNLCRFCSVTKIDDVMFFINCEELNIGHMTVEETLKWLDMIIYCRKRLEPMEITTSLNPYCTILHEDRGRQPINGYKFVNMVDMYGKSCSVVVCPLCDEWRGYIGEIYKCYADIKPYSIWVDDDFRLHNHPPLYWGGCFCELHMNEFSKKIGKIVSREEFVQGLLKPGRPHEYRKIWLDTMCKTMAGIAEYLGKTVHETSPETLFGLMSSMPKVHCAEGRDWESILKGLSQGGIMLNRTNLPSYREISAQGYCLGFNSTSRQTAAVVPDKTFILPELESSPYTRFSKSKAFTGFQVESALALGCKGITMNIFDMMGNGVNTNDGYGDILVRIKDYLDSVKKQGLALQHQKGVKVLFSDKSSYTINTAKGDEIIELYPNETFWAELLSAYGVSNTYSKEKKHKKSIVAVSGQWFRNLDYSEIVDLFNDNFIIMNGDAAFTLYDMGLGEIAGIKNVSWHKVHSGFQSYEQVCNGKEYCGFKDARMSMLYSVGDYLSIDYSNTASVIATANNHYGKVVGNGLAINDNRVFIYPYGHFQTNIWGASSDSYLCHLSSVRQEIIHDVIHNCTQYDKPIMIENMPYVCVYEYSIKGETLVFTANFSADDYSSIRFTNYITDFNSIMEISKKSVEPEKVDYLFDGRSIIVNSNLCSLETKLFIFNRTR